MELGEDGSVYKSILVRNLWASGEGERTMPCGAADVVLGLNRQMEDDSRFIYLLKKILLMFYF